MKLALAICIVALSQLQGYESAVRRPRQTRPPIANGEVLTSIFQIPITTLTSVNKLFQASRTRIQAVQAYQAQMQQQQQQNLIQQLGLARPQGVIEQLGITPSQLGGIFSWLSPVQQTFSPFASNQISSSLFRPMKHHHHHHHHQQSFLFKQPKKIVNSKAIFKVKSAGKRS